MDDPPPDAAQLPFATATVGQIYLDQGKLEQAEEVFRHVLARHPRDARSERGLAEIERRRQAETILVVDSVEVEVDPAAHAEGGGGCSLTCRWKISGDGRRRARLVSGEDGALVLRLAIFPAAPEAPPADTPLPGDSGTLSLPLPDRADRPSLAATAVGLLTPSGQFVSIAHSKLVQLSSTDL